MNNKSLTIRVYGLLINEKKEVLISDEKRYDFCFTKFPGGGLEWGEGIHDALKREFKEELEIDIEVQQQFYLTDFFQVSAFHENIQVVSIYFIVKSKDGHKIKTRKHPFFEENKENHRWIPITDLSEGIFTFPIDKIVAENLNKSNI